MVKDLFSFAILVVIFLNFGSAWSQYYDDSKKPIPTSCQFLRNLNEFQTFSQKYFNRTNASDPFNLDTNKVINALRHYENGKFHLGKIMNSSRYNSERPIIIINFIATGIHTGSVPCQGKFPVNDNNEYDNYGENEDEICCQNDEHTENEYDGDIEGEDTGGWIENNPKKPEFKKLASYILLKKGINARYIDVTSVKSEEMGTGTNYEIDFDYKNAFENYLYSCHSSILKYKRGGYTIYDFQCSPKTKPSDNWNNPIYSEDEKYELPIESDKIIPGSWVERDPKDPEIKQLAIQVMKKKGQSTIFLNVTSARSQIVNGINYAINLDYLSIYHREIYSCKTEFHRSLKGQIEIKKFFCHPKREEKSSIENDNWPNNEPSGRIELYVKKTKGRTANKENNTITIDEPINGNWVEIDAKNPEIKKRAEKVLKKNGKSYSFVKVTKAQIELDQQLQRRKNFNIDFDYMDPIKKQAYSCNTQVNDSENNEISIVKLSCHEKITPF